MSESNKVQSTDIDIQFANRHRKRKWKRDHHSNNDLSNNKQNVLEMKTEPCEKFRKKYRGPNNKKNNLYRFANFGNYVNKGLNRDNAERNKKLKPVQCLKEDEVGITESINDKRFFGILKMRYTDFHVNEIGKDGRVSKLTEQKIPHEIDTVQDIEEIRKELPESIWEALQNIKDSNNLPLEIDVSDCSKLQRQKIHECVRILGKDQKLVSNTVEKGEKKVIAIRGGKAGNDQRGKERINFKRYGGEWCRFVLHKLNVHTMTAIIQMASTLRIKPNKFSFAGTKDRRGCTSQWFTLWKVHPNDILRAAKNARGVFVGNFEFVKEPLHLGQLAGNRFRIALRNITESNEEVERAMISLKTNGFINYFGLQRFGAHASVPSYAIGIALLQGQWEKAVDLILTPKEEEEDQDLTEAKKIYKTTRNAADAYAKIKNTSSIEAELLKGIRACGNKNLFGALDWTPKTMRSMYMHSYQSLVWNNMVSRRIKTFGKDPIVGDLVYAEENVEEIVESECNDEWDNIADKDNTLESNSDSIKSQEDDKPLTTVQKDTERRNKIPAVKILTEDDVSRYTLSDVIMPTPGNSVVYPPYAKAWFEEFLARDSLPIDLQQKHAQYSLPGNYRNILQIPSKLSWRIMRHKEMTSNLLMSDIDEMRGTDPPQDEPDGQYKSLIIDISLKASTYATMALREVLSCGTSKEEQTGYTEKFQTTVNESSEPLKDTELSGESENTNDVEAFHAVETVSASTLISTQDSADL